METIAFLIWMAAITVIAIDTQWSCRRLKKMLDSHPDKGGEAGNVRKDADDQFDAS